MCVSSYATVRGISQELVLSFDYVGAGKSHSGNQAQQQGALSIRPLHQLLSAAPCLLLHFYLFILCAWGSASLILKEWKERKKQSIKGTCIRSDFC